MSDLVHELPPEIRGVLDTLRKKIRKYVLWEGAALVLALLGLLFWGTFLVDAAYFSLSRLELPRWLRAVCLFGAITVSAGAVTTLLLWRVLRRFRSRALALVLERRFPQLGDGLITSVELSEGRLGRLTGFQQAMLERSMADAGRRLEGLDLAKVFDSAPVQRAGVAALALVIPIVALAAVDSPAMERWFQGFIQLDSEYWPRRTRLDVHVVTQPGDRVREFRGGMYRHPRGGDLQLVISPREGFERPERVQLDYRMRGGSWKRLYLSAAVDQPFQHVFAALLDDVDVWISAGDFATPRPWRIQVVDPPRLDHVALSVRYPDYTGLNSGNGPTVVPVLGSQVALPMGSRFELQGECNKPLSRVRMDVQAGAERFELELLREPGSATEPRTTGTVLLRARDDQPEHRAPLPETVTAAFLSGDLRHFALPVVLRPQGVEELKQFVIAGGQGHSMISGALPWPADSVLRIHLEDIDEIGSPEPARLALGAIMDQPPSLEVELQGIGTSITRQARIPVAGLIHDDYGVATARFEYQVNGQGDWTPREFASPPKTISQDFRLARAADEAFERFDVLPLDLSLKQQLSLTVFAADGDTLHGPNSQRGQKFVFTIVSVEELLSLLYAKELNLRKRFEQILTELKNLEEDLKSHQRRLVEAQGALPHDLEQALSACGERSLQGLRKNAAETEAVAAEFRAIREELVNNAAETPQNMERLNHKILQPLEVAVHEDFQSVDAALGLFSLANEKHTDRVRPLQESLDSTAALIRRLEQVLLEMRKLETFHEALELLKAIISAQDELLEETKTQRKERALRALE